MKRSTDFCIPRTWQCAKNRTFSSVTSLYAVDGVRVSDAVFELGSFNYVIFSLLIKCFVVVKESLSDLFTTFDSC